MKLVLDTSFLIELLKGNKRAISALEERKEKAVDIAVSAFTVYELMVGAYYLWKKYDDPRELARVEHLLTPLTIIPITEDVALKAAKIQAMLKLEGVEMRDADIIIACTEDGEVLTFDKDFEPLKKLGFNITILKRT